MVTCNYSTLKELITLPYWENIIEIWHTAIYIQETCGS